jgi:hypothetical protein
LVGFKHSPPVVVISGQKLGGRKWFPPFQS